ncbi:MAG TPA: SAM-dependent methyltransferase, partial [Anaerolineae bacterium]|nr:SAM-dependent methyltransferase [Anaerolineae bacterium]
MNFDLLKPHLDQALASRQGIHDSASDTAYRLFNGFYEGYPSLALDIYASTLLIHDYSDEPSQNLINEVVDYLRKNVTWLRAGILKTRNGKTPDQKRGQILFGDNPDKKIRENGFWYAIDLTMNRDASFYLDTSNLRKWLIENSKDKTILNTFAYTGSLGVAAMAGGASKVVQTDRNKNFLNLAKDSYSLNNFPIQKQNFIAQDFFPVISRFKTGKQTFDCVIIDPPIFSSTSKGKVDLENESMRLINKVRPLFNDGG